MNEVKKEAKRQTKYSKSAFLEAEQSSKERLILQVLLDEDRTYAIAEVGKIVETWKNKEAKA